MSGRLDAAQVRAMAGGHWDHVFAMLAPSLERAMERPGRHVPCPAHGGRDAFRLYRDYAENGASVCNTCGAQSGRTVCVLVPTGPIPDGATGIDWNDVLRDGGTFPVAS